MCEGCQGEYVSRLRGCKASGDVWPDGEPVGRHFLIQENVARIVATSLLTNKGKGII